MKVALIKGDGIGVDVAEAAIAVVDAVVAATGMPALTYDEIRAGASYFDETGQDIEPGGETRAGEADAVFLGAIGLPTVRHADGTEIGPHLRLRDIHGLYAGVRPVKAFPNAPQPLADPRAAWIDLIILRESTEGLFYSAAAHDRAEVIGDAEVRDTLRITRATTEKLMHFGFNLARKRRTRGKPGRLTCVDKANVFASMAFFRKIYDEVAAEYPDVETGYSYVDAQALNLVRHPWDYDVMVMENMFGDILSDLAGGLVGGMGMAACAEIGDTIGLFQPAHGSAPDIMGQDKANPLAAILSGALMLDYLAEKSGDTRFEDAAQRIEHAVEDGFAAGTLRPMELGGDMGTRAVTNEVLAQVPVGKV
ncbi:MAG: isocitrate/isopropylmalate dehydrogenase family protein [Boseongicola sp. SB0676_bin_33]|uniref:3-isopropylmalate dehydrogenase n=1 Tax=Boseongicola sp. SB0664_bin_43 TaxID=2604844 RepID=A0A6B0XVP0_9RHOB|nr:isocitrate/isopropylmalate dehydrogenase family protein [Boseongicola sp. SB0664_bin_43]MYF89212.1 isocitrate/isopropylmalate dehydrogenase family protein [Boseongicola sp. SB0676_bin_33]MYK33256.1 isocitrate/isopropylmalate dehydrogenase family protein [Boseongicola sp. SB0670_bin_30]